LSLAIHGSHNVLRSAVQPGNPTASFITYAAKGLESV
jgi:hypothetical protein